MFHVGKGRNRDARKSSKLARDGAPGQCELLNRPIPAFKPLLPSGELLRIAVGGIPHPGSLGIVKARFVDQIVAQARNIPEPRRNGPHVRGLCLDRHWVNVGIRSRTKTITHLSRSLLHLHLRVEGKKREYYLYVMPGC